MKRYFNIQPWRQEKVVRDKKNFLLISLLIALAVVLLCLLYSRLLQSDIDKQIAAIAYLNHEKIAINHAKKEVTHIRSQYDELLIDIKTIEDLRQKAGGATDILSFLANIVSGNVFLNTLSYEDHKLVIEGIAKNENEISALIRNFSGNKNFQNVSLIYIKDAVDTKRYSVDEKEGIKTFKIAVDFNRESLVSGSKNEN